MNKAIFITLMLLIPLAGCLEKEATEEPTINYGMGEHIVLTHHQYEGAAPMGMGNTSNVELNNTNISVMVNVSVESMFHEPVLWEQGFVNISIMDEEENMLWQNQTNEFADWTVVLSDNFSWTGNLSFRTLSEGSDNPTDDKPGDWYIVEYNTTWQWIEA